MRSKREKSYIAEICCGGFYDARQAALGGAERIELNSALMLGGLTPTVSTLDLIKEQFPGLRVVAMVRPRGAGFCYGEEEFWAMETDACERMPPWMKRKTKDSWNGFRNVGGRPCSIVPLIAAKILIWQWSN